MFGASLICLFLCITFGLFGFHGVPVSTTTDLGVCQALFFIFLVAFLITLVMYLVNGSGRPYPPL